MGRERRLKRLARLVVVAVASAVACVTVAVATARLAFDAAGAPSSGSAVFAWTYFTIVPAWVTVTCLAFAARSTRRAIALLGIVTALAAIAQLVAR